MSRVSVYSANMDDFHCQCSPPQNKWKRDTTTVCRVFSVAPAKENQRCRWLYMLNVCLSCLHRAESWYLSFNPDTTKRDTTLLLHTSPHSPLTTSVPVRRPTPPSSLEKVWALVCLGGKCFFWFVITCSYLILTWVHFWMNECTALWPKQLLLFWVCVSATGHGARNPLTQSLFLFCFIVMLQQDVLLPKTSNVPLPHLSHLSSH